MNWKEKIKMDKGKKTLIVLCLTTTKLFFFLLNCNKTTFNYAP